jgi:hypothetical protein
MDPLIRRGMVLIGGGHIEIVRRGILIEYVNFHIDIE